MTQTQEHWYHGLLVSLTLLHLLENSLPHNNMIYTKTVIGGLLLFWTQLYMPSWEFKPDNQCAHAPQPPCWCMNSDSKLFKKVGVSMLVVLVLWKSAGRQGKAGRWSAFKVNRTFCTGWRKSVRHARLNAGRPLLITQRHTFSFACKLGKGTNSNQTPKTNSEHSCFKLCMYVNMLAWYKVLQTETTAWLFSVNLPCMFFVLKQGQGNM